MKAVGLGRGMPEVCKVVVDSMIAGMDFLPSDERLNDGVQWQLLPGESITREGLLKAEADALWVRSVTPVTRALLEGTRVRFVGSCTIGTDHVDLNALEDLGIYFAHAPGCNAQAVVEYVMATVLHWAVGRQKKTQSLTLGIVGYGHIGQLLERTYIALTGRRDACVVYDPLLMIDGQGPAPVMGWQSWADVWQADVVSVHVPLTRADQSAYPTHHMIREAELSALSQTSQQQLLINCARGDVISESALLNVLQAPSSTLDVALDVYPNEPILDPELLARLWQATPHIAGHSQWGKWQGTAMVLQQFLKTCEGASDVSHISNASRQLEFSLAPAMQSAPPMKTVNATAGARSVQAIMASNDLSGLYALCTQTTPVWQLSSGLKNAVLSAAGAEDRAAAFRRQRRAYTPRLEWRDVRFD